MWSSCKQSLFIRWPTLSLFTLLSFEQTEIWIGQFRIFEKCLPISFMFQFFHKSSIVEAQISVCILSKNRKLCFHFSLRKKNHLTVFRVCHMLESKWMKKNWWKNAICGKHVDLQLHLLTNRGFKNIVYGVIYWNKNYFFIWKIARKWNKKSGEEKKWDILITCWWLEEMKQFGHRYTGWRLFRARRLRWTSGQRWGVCTIGHNALCSGGTKFTTLLSWYGQ